MITEKPQVQLLTSPCVR